MLLKPLQYRDPDQLVILMGGATPTRFAEMQKLVFAVTAVLTLALAIGWESDGISPEPFAVIRILLGDVEPATDCWI